jgi:alpha-maltose-1-phosphate synthase
MRIAHVLRKYNPSEWGGTESALLQLTADLAGLGVHSVVYAPRLSAGPPTADPFAAAGCTVRRFRACVPVWGISAERRRQMVAVGGNLVSCDLVGSLGCERNIDLVHAHAMGRLGAIARVVARARRLPFVVSVHGGLYDLPASVLRDLRGDAGGWDWGKPLGFLLRARQLMEQADAIVTLNPREAELIRERHPGKRVLAMPHGIPTAKFAPDCRAAAEAAFPAMRGRAVLLVVGRIDPTKNQDWLVAQAAELARRHPGILLVFAGACTHREYGAALQARLEREGLQDVVLMVGGLPSGDARLIGLLQAARAVVVPSLSETFGIVILEAWAAGTPVISSRTSGALGLVQEGVNGLLFDVAEPARFHSAVDEVLLKPELAARMGAAGRARAVGDFDTSVSAPRMKRFYEELIEEKNALRHSQGR